MKRILFSKIIILWFLLVFTVCLSSRTTADSVSEYDDIQILKSDQEGVIFKYLVPELDQSKTDQVGQIFDLVNIEKCGLSNLPGKPQLPVRRVVIGVPLDAEIGVEVLEKAGTERSG